MYDGKRAMEVAQSDHGTVYYKVNVLIVNTVIIRALIRVVYLLGLRSNYQTTT